MGDEGSRVVLKSAINANLFKDLTRIVNHLKLVQAAIRRCSVPRGKLSQTVDEVNSIIDVRASGASLYITIYVQLFRFLRGDVQISPKK